MHTATSPRPPLRILLLSPRGPLYRHRTGTWKKSPRYAPLTLTTLAALVPRELGAEVTMETYLAVCQAQGQRAGDIKPVALHRGDGWSQYFLGRML